MKINTVKDLHDFLGNLIKENKGDLPVYFDTEASTFDYHMAKVGAAYEEDKYVTLHE